MYCVSFVVDLMFSCFLIVGRALARQLVQRALAR